MLIKHITVFLIAILCFNCSYALATGPWKGKVIDAETKEPIEGAVVLAVWDRNYRTPTGGSSYFYEAKEVLTDKEGRFEIPAYTPINLLPLISYIEGPFFTVFKQGYGSFPWHRVSPPMEMSLDVIAEYFTKEVGERGEILQRSQVPATKGKILKRWNVTFGIVELPKLKTREERREVVLSLSSGLVDVPDNKKQNLIYFIKMERDYIYKEDKK